MTWVCSLAVVVGIDLMLQRGRRDPDRRWHLEPAATGWPRPGRGGARRDLLGLSPWLVLVLVVATWDVLALDTGPHRYHLTISALAQAYRPLNAAVLIVWMLAGFGYQVARVRAPAVGAPGKERTEPPAGPATFNLAAPLLAAPALAEPIWRARVAAGLTGTGRPAMPALLLPQHPALGVAFWIATGVAAVVIELVARGSHGRLARAEELVRFVSTPAWARIILVGAWLFAGFHLFAR